jgi:hypothetical protein
MHERLMAGCSNHNQKYLEPAATAIPEDAAAAAAQAFKPLFNVQSLFLRNAHPTVNLALPPVGVHSTVLQRGHITTLVEWLNTVVILAQPVHLTSIK